MATGKYTFNALVRSPSARYDGEKRARRGLFFSFQRRASSTSNAVASTVNQRNAAQSKSGQYGVPQRVNLPKESINVSLRNDPRGRERRRSAQVTKLSNGLVVASMENNSPVFRVAAVVQAGAKHEPYESRGVTTLLRVFSNLVTNFFGLRRSSRRVVRLCRARSTSAVLV